MREILSILTLYRVSAIVPIATLLSREHPGMNGNGGEDHQRPKMPEAASEDQDVLGKMARHDSLL
ncbi:MAG: hypothetical protein WA817_11050 [Candidatus Acidiferrum sp.]